MAPHDRRVSTNNGEITIVGWRAGGGGGGGGTTGDGVWDAGTRSVVSGGADVSELQASVIRSMGMERGLVKFFFLPSHIVGEEEGLRRNTSLFFPLFLLPHAKQKWSLEQSSEM